MSTEPALSQVGARHFVADLLERDGELAQLNTCVDAAVAGEGRLVLLSGPAGIGKTVLVGSCCRLAAKQGLVPLQARPVPLEADLPFAVVRQLFERHLARLAQSERATVFEGAAMLSAPIFGFELARARTLAMSPGGITAQPLAALHGLYWLVASLSERRPLLLAVDDAQWADSASLRFLAYLVQRIDDLPVMVLLVIRSGEPSEISDLLSDVLNDTKTLTLEPNALSAHAVGAMVRAGLSPDAHEDFCQACFQATRGNPFFLHELIIQLRKDRIEPIAANAELVATARPATITRTVLARIDRLGSTVVDVARAAAVLGTSGTLRTIATLVAYSRDEVALALDLLQTADILSPTRPIQFVHPLVRDALYNAIPSTLRMLLHDRSARLLDVEGRAAETVAAHLLQTEPQGDPWVVERMRRAATVALGRGAPELAVTSLRRARAEPPAPNQSPEVVAELAEAEAAAIDPNAPTDLECALGLIEDYRRHAKLARLLATHLLHEGRTAAAADVLRRALERVGDNNRELSLQIDAELSLLLTLDGPSRVASWARLDTFDIDAEPVGLGRSLLLADLAGRAAYRADPVDQAVAFAERALSDWRSMARDAVGSGLLASALNVLVWSDRLDEADRLCDEIVADAAVRGAVLTVVLLAPIRAEAAHRRGELANAEAYGSEGLGLALRHGMMTDLALAAGTVASTLIDLGRLDDAYRVLGQRPDPTSTANPTDAWTLYARGFWRVAKHDTATALDDFLQCGERLVKQGCVNPSVVPWRSQAALAQARLGNLASARDLAHEELSIARAYKASRAIGIALRTLGLLERGHRSLELLVEAVNTLRATEARLDLAQAQVDYGGALRRQGHKADALEPLRQGLDLASRCGAVPLVDRARAELVAAGARPRRERVTGAAALTATERRIAQMATEGLTNRQIAQQLFISIKTVSIHLTRAYQKLSISDRSQFRSALLRSR